MEGNACCALEAKSSLPGTWYLNHSCFFSHFFFYFLAAAVQISGWMAVLEVMCLGTFCILSVIQLAMVMQRDKVVLNYSACVITKLVLAVVACKHFFFLFRYRNVVSGCWKASVPPPGNAFIINSCQRTSDCSGDE